MMAQTLVYASLAQASTLTPDSPSDSYHNTCSSSVSSQQALVSRSTSTIGGGAGGGRKGGKGGHSSIEVVVTCSSQPSVISKSTTTSALTQQQVLNLSPSGSQNQHQLLSLAVSTHNSSGHQVLNSSPTHQVLNSSPSNQHLLNSSPSPPRSHSHRNQNNIGNPRLTHHSYHEFFSSTGVPDHYSHLYHQHSHPHQAHHQQNQHLHPHQHHLQHSIHHQHLQHQHSPNSSNSSSPNTASYLQQVNGSPPLHLDYSPFSIVPPTPGGHPGPNTGHPGPPGIGPSHTSTPPGESLAVITPTGRSSNRSHTMQQVSGGGQAPPPSGGYCEEDDLPSCAYAHAHHRLHGIPFLVHGEYLNILIYILNHNI